MIFLFKGKSLAMNNLLF
uniref:Uncharacterized protein n=1 Tax=Anguilla anguilla TaxID=7936 RepID=A0A0E9PYN6_ANGAN